MLNNINEEIKNAMKNGNKFLLSVLRLLKSAIQLESISKKHDLTDEEIISVIKKQVKTRKDSIAEFEKYDKIEQVDSLKKEIDILEKYLPEEMNLEDIKKVLEEIFQEINPTSMKDFGLCMKAAKTNDKLKNADMSLVNQLIKARLN